MKYIELKIDAAAPERALRFFSCGELVYDLKVRAAESGGRVYTCPVPVEYDGCTLGGEPYTPAQADGPAERAQSAERPRVCFTAPEGWLNDPNGLVFAGGLYHMFYQHNPAGPTWGNMSWGHAVSEDLISWSDRPAALCPDALGTMFSGSAIAENGVLWLFYTAAGGNNELSRGKNFSQCAACSHDGGQTFEKHGSNPVVPTITNQNRDPKVVRDGRGGYLMALYLENNDYALLKSQDLLGWTRCQTITLPEDAECPDIYPLMIDGEEKWIFTGASDRYFVGTFRNGLFVPEGASKRVHSGSESYAAQTFSDEPGGRRIKIGWNRWSRLSLPDEPYHCSMTVPQEQSLRRIGGELFLCSTPIPELESSGIIARRETDGSRPFEAEISGIPLRWDGSRLAFGPYVHRLPRAPFRLTTASDGHSVQLFVNDGEAVIAANR